MEHESSENIMDDETASLPFSEKMHGLAERAKCLRNMTRAEARRFDDLWNGGQNKIMGSNGKMRHTRWLGYKLDNTACFEGSFDEYHSYQAEESYCVISIEKVYRGGTYQLINHEGERPVPPVSGRYLKKYYT
jgi:hypothetical protein